MTTTAVETTADSELLAAEPGQMRVQKRNGTLEQVDLNKIVRANQRCAEGLDGVDPMMIAVRTIAGVHDGVTTSELDLLSIRTAAAHIVEEPNYSKFAARILSNVIDKEIRNQNIHAFSQSVVLGHQAGLVSDETAAFVEANKRKLNDAIDKSRDNLFEYFGLRTVYDRYLLRHPESRLVIELPQYFFMRVACGLATAPDEAIELYALMSNLEYLTSSPTLFNSGTRHSQMSSCYLLDSPEDDLGAIYGRYGDIAQLSKFAGGIGVSWSRIRARGSLIKGTNGKSNGIVPWLKTLDSSVAAVNQCFAPDTLVITSERPRSDRGGRRAGSRAWHRRRVPQGDSGVLVRERQADGVSDDEAFSRAGHGHRRSPLLRDSGYPVGPVGFPFGGAAQSGEGPCRMGAGQGIEVRRLRRPSRSH